MKRILGKLLIIIAIIAAIFCALVSGGVTLSFLPALLTSFSATAWGAIAVGALAMASIVDPKGTQEAIKRVGNTTRSLVAGIAGGIVGGLASGVANSGLLGVLLIGGALYLLFSGNNNNKVNGGFRNEESYRKTGLRSGVMRAKEI